MVARAPGKPLPPGTSLSSGKFSVGRVLGEGGFGITYKGAHKELRRPVAIKELFPAAMGAVRAGARVSVPTAHRDAFRRAQDRALEEARAIAGFRSPHIVDVYDMFREHGTAYIVMEYLDGPTLETRLREAGTFSAREARHLALNLCEALEEVHGRNLLHRDIKPANIVWLPNDRTVLIDFGSARLFDAGRTMRHTRILTEEYAAPEQYSPRARFGPYTDLFGLGATLYHVVTGTPPPVAMERLLGRGMLNFPSDLDHFLRTSIWLALELQMEERPQTVGDFRRYLVGEKTAPAPDDPSASSVAAPRPPADPDAAVAYFDQGRVQEMSGRYIEAIAAYDQALRLDPNYAQAYFQRGYAQGKLGRHAQTVADYDQVLRLDPGYALAYNNRGWSRGQLGQHAQAIADCDQALSLDPDNALAYNNRGWSRGQLGQHAQAIADYGQALRIDPNYALAYRNRGYAKGELGQHAQAIADYDQSLRLDPDNAQAYLNRGRAKGELGQHVQAIADYDQSLRLDPNYVQAYLNRGVAKGKLGRHVQAIADYDQALRLDPNHVQAYLNRGWRQRQLGQYAQAIVDYSQVLRLDPDHALAYFQRGWNQGQLGQHVQAIADYDQVLRLDPDDAVAYNNRGVNQGQLGRHIQAIADYDQALRCAPNYVPAYLNRGIAKGALGWHAQAIADYDQVLRLEPDHAQAYNHRKWCQEQLDGRAEAITGDSLRRWMLYGMDVYVTFAPCFRSFFARRAAETRRAPARKGFA